MSERLSASSFDDTPDIFDLMGDSFNEVEDVLRLDPEMVQRTIEVHGDQLYQYGPYIGTVTDALAGGCPAMQAALVNGGPEGVTSLVAGKEISQEEADRIRNPVQDDEQKNKTHADEETPPEKNEEINKRAKAVAQAAELVHQKYTKEEVVTQAVSTEIIQNTEQQSAVAIVPSEVSDKLQGTSLPEVAVTLKDSSGEAVTENADTPLSDILPAVGSDIVPREVSTVEDYVKKPSTPIEAADVSGEINDASRVAAEPASVGKEVIYTAPLPSNSVPIDRATPFAGTEQITEVNEEHTEVESVDELYEAAIEVSAVDEVVQEEMPLEAKAIFEKYENYDVDTVVTLEDSPDRMETPFFLAVVEEKDVADLQLTESAEDAAYESPELRETSQNLQSVYEHENEVQSDTLEDHETLRVAVEIVTGFTEIEPEFETDETPAEIARYGKVIQQSIKKLEQAQTKEECAEHVEALQKSLAELLESLGFARSQELAHQLVRRYDMKTLKQFIAALMKSVTAGEVAQHGLQKKVLPINHHWFGKRVVERVVRAATGVQLQAA